MGAVEFNPTARPGSPDYGLLYTSGSDLGFSNGGGPNAINPGQTQRLDSVITAILRIDPRSPSVTGGVKGLGDYTIPAINKFAADGDPATLGEIFAYGFRNAHRLSWDLTDGTMFASDIGMNHIEEINIVHEGRNYGWMKREAYFENGITRPGGALNQLYPLPAEVLDGRQKDEFTYPVAIYDHDEGRAVSGGFAYYGRIAALRGKFVFGDVQRRSPVRGRPRGDEEGRRRHSADGRAGRGDSALRARRGRQARERHVAGTRRAHDGAARASRGSPHRSQRRRRAVHHVEAGRHDPNARGVRNDMRALVSRRAALLVACLLIFVRIAAADDIRVMTSGTFTAAYLELRPQLERSLKVKIVTTATSMGVGSESIPSRLERGEAVDVVIVADDALNQLIKNGRVLADSRVELARSGIGMAVRKGAPKPDISSVDALKRTLLQAKSIAYSASVSGQYLTTELFQRLGIADQVHG